MLALRNEGGLVDRRFHEVNMCRTFGWTHEEYLERPLYFDSVYEVMCKAEAKNQQLNANSLNK